MSSDMHDGGVEFADIQWRNSPLRLEYQWVGARRSEHPVVVFLHEGLGSIALWKDFPKQFCLRSRLDGTGVLALRLRSVHPQAGTKRSGRSASCMSRRIRCCRPCSLIWASASPGCSAIATARSIALLYASRFSEQLSGVVVAAPHILVEDLTIASIRVAREVYLTQDLRTKLGRYHADPDSAFWGWNDIWLDPAFRAWNIENDLSTISCPVLAIQGEDDEYGTLEQIYGIQRKIPATRIVVLPQCGHSPHRDQPEALSQEVAQFITHRV